MEDAGSHKFLYNHSKALRTPSLQFLCLSHRDIGVHPQSQTIVHLQSHKLYIWVKLSKKVKELQCTQVLTGCAW